LCWPRELGVAVGKGAVYVFVADDAAAHFEALFEEFLVEGVELGVGGHLCGGEEYEFGRIWIVIRMNGFVIV